MHLHHVILFAIVAGILLPVYIWMVRLFQPIVFAKEMYRLWLSSREARRYNKQSHREQNVVADELEALYRLKARDHHAA